MLIWPFAHVGVGIATALSAWVNVALLWIVLRRRNHIQADARLRAKAWRILLASLVMGAALYLGSVWVDGLLGDGLWRRIAVLSALIAAGGAIYALAIFVTGAYRLSELKALLRRHPPAASTATDTPTTPPANIE